MQTTLLGLAIAIILALVAALVGPLLLDWGSHRTLLEAEASRLIGVNVRVTGGIDARLLPSPRLTLHDIQIGDGGETIRARSLGVEFALGSLMRGEWRAADLHLVGPQVRLGLDSSGRLQAPNLAMTFKPDELSIDRLSIEDGTVVLADAASGTSLTLGRVWFNGEARSLAGPVKGDGAVTVAGALYPYRLALGRLSDAGTLKLHLNVDPTDYPLNFEADGTLAVAGNTPGFDGTLGLARPVGIGLRRPGPAAGEVTQPWRVGGKIKATAQSALMQDVEFQYGSEEQGLRLTGVADFKFGAEATVQWGLVRAADRCRPGCFRGRCRETDARSRDTPACCARNKRIPHIATGAAWHRHRSDNSRRQRLAEFARRYHQQCKRMEPRSSGIPRAGSDPGAAQRASRRRQ